MSRDPRLFIEDIQEAIRIVDAFVGGPLRAPFLQRLGGL